MRGLAAAPPITAPGQHVIFKARIDPSRYKQRVASFRCTAAAKQQLLVGFLTHFFFICLQPTLQAVSFLISPIIQCLCDSGLCTPTSFGEALDCRYAK